MVKVEWPKVMDINKLDSKPICNWIDLGNGTMFRIGAYFTYRFHGMPRDGLFVGIERVGCFLFSLENVLNWEYVSDKLYVPESDARALADWINVQLEHDAPQQGTYNPDYINGVEPYGLIGEKFIMPLVPEIIMA